MRISDWRNAGRFDSVRRFAFEETGFAYLEFSAIRNPNSEMPFHSLLGGGMKPARCVSSRASHTTTILSIAM
jgi:hypothetical protein